MREHLMQGIPRTVADDVSAETVKLIEESLIEDLGQTVSSALLSPCPFCGSNEPFVQVHEWSECYVEARVVCSSCHVATSEEAQSWRVEIGGRDVTRLLAIGRAISRWNRRA